MMKKVFETCEKFKVECQASLERYMKCGFGVCGACSMGSKSACMNGPVFGSVDLRNSDFGKYKRCKSGKLGGFGNESIERSFLVKSAMNKFNVKNGVVVFGDTPRDIEAARKVNVKVVAVATGIYSKEDLKDADYVFEDMSDTNKVLRAIHDLIR